MNAFGCGVFQVARSIKYGVKRTVRHAVAAHQQRQFNSVKPPMESIALIGAMYKRELDAIQHPSVTTTGVPYDASNLYRTKHLIERHGMNYDQALSTLKVLGYIK